MEIPALYSSSKNAKLLRRTSLTGTESTDAFGEMFFRIYSNSTRIAKKP
jgi:hypothetical protein